MAAIVRIKRSDKEYLLWMLCIIYHILEFSFLGYFTCSKLPEEAQTKEELFKSTISFKNYIEIPARCIVVALKNIIRFLHSLTSDGEEKLIKNNLRFRRWLKLTWTVHVQLKHIFQINPFRKNNWYRQTLENY